MKKLKELRQELSIAERELARVRRRRDEIATMIIPAGREALRAELLERYDEDVGECERKVWALESELDDARDSLLR